MHRLISLSALMSVKEMAKGITYEDPIKTRLAAFNSPFICQIICGVFLQIKTTSINFRFSLQLERAPLHFWHAGSATRTCTEEVPYSC